MLVSLLLAPALAMAAGEASQPVPVPSESAGSGYESLFNGVDLDGWDGEPGLWWVENGVVVGSTDGHPLQQNSFLISEESFTDFDLHFEVRLRNGNSGMQFRSRRTSGWTVRGYQADLAEGKGWGNLHGEGLPGGLILDGWQDKSEFIVRPGWNSIAILCVGHRIRITVNGTVVNDVLDPGALDGILALQLHRGGPMRVEYRNIRIRRLPRP